MSIRIRRKPIKDAIKDLTYVNDYISEWKNDDNVLPTGAHQQRYNIISTLVEFAFNKLTEEMERTNGSRTISTDIGQSEGSDSGNQETESSDDS